MLAPDGERQPGVHRGCTLVHAADPLGDGDHDPEPELLTAAERLQYDGYLRREDTNTTILEQATAGMTIKEIARKSSHSRGLVRRVLRGQRSDVFRTRKARSSSICHGWRRSGPAVTGTASAYGAG